ncbi:MAG: hypothetical protein C4581_06605 [Nitrospiraceae bacterium]|nr:MAG: hypothetical protein C4581_06605 [Nitrospiraceae bacterium]
MTKFVALKNVYKQAKKDPDYRIYENGNLKESVGVMYRCKAKNGLAYFNIRFFQDKEWNS